MFNSDLWIIAELEAKHSGMSFSEQVAFYEAICDAETHKQNTRRPPRAAQIERQRQCVEKANIALDRARSSEERARIRMEKAFERIAKLHEKLNQN